MTFFAFLFAFSPSLEAYACAAEGCDPACAERSAEPMLFDAGNSDADDCVDSQCICVVGHCSHVAVSVAPISVAIAFTLVSDRVATANEEPAFVSVTTPERPPRI